MKINKKCFRVNSVVLETSKRILERYILAENEEDAKIRFEKKYGDITPMAELMDVTEEITIEPVEGIKIEI